MEQASPETPSPAHQNIGRRVGIASIYAVLQRVALRGLGFGSTLILVRLLSPEDFGIAVLASAVLATLDLLTWTGFGLAIVRMPAPRAGHYDTAFTLTVLRGAVLAVILFALADWQARFMNEPRLASVIHVIAITVFVDSMASMRLVDFHRDLRFDVLLRYAVVGKVLAMLVSIPLAFILQNYWALVLGNLVSRVLCVPYSYWLAPHRPRLTFSEWRELFGFSKWVLLNNVCVVFDQQVMNFVVGRVQGVSAIGLYQVGAQIGLLPITELAAPIRQPFYAGFARIYHDLVELRRQFLTGLELLWVLLLPLSLGIALTGREVTLLFLGPQWTEAIPLLPLIALFGLTDAIGQNTHNLFIVLNRQARLVVSYFALVVLRLIAVYVGTLKAGILGAAWAMLLTSCLNAIVWQWLANQLLAISLRDLARRFWRPGVAALLLVAVVWPIPDDIGPRLGITIWPTVTSLAIKTVLGAVAYIGMLGLCWWLSGQPRPSAESHILAWSGAALRRLRRPGISAQPS
jgi:O-antigen/teichoic acid export membrane protein